MNLADGSADGLQAARQGRQGYLGRQFPDRQTAYDDFQPQ
jgi:hypothetical protein